MAQNESNRWDWISDGIEFIPADATGVDSIPKAPLDDKLRDLNLTVGKYRFTIGRPTGTISQPLGEQPAVCQWVDIDGTLQTKRITVSSVVYDATVDKLTCIVDVHENPVPAIVIWGVVWTVVLVVGAVAANSVLEKVESLVTETIGSVGGLVNTVGKAAKSFPGILIIAIFLLPAVVSLISVIKKR